MDPDAALDVSVLIPVHDERENLRPLWDQLAAALDGAGDLRWEVLFVDDGSADGSAAILAALAAEQPGPGLPSGASPGSPCRLPGRTCRS